MAGWDAYIDSIISKSTDDSGMHCDKACIIGLNGAKWTSDGHKNALKISQPEASAIASYFSSGNFSNFQASGVTVEGVKYQFLRGEDGKLVLAKKKGSGSLTLQSSKSAIVIGHCSEGKQHGIVNKAVASIAEYLEAQNM